MTHYSSEPIARELADGASLCASTRQVHIIHAHGYLAQLFRDHARSKINEDFSGGKRQCSSIAKRDDLVNLCRLSFSEVLKQMCVRNASVRTYMLGVYVCVMHHVLQKTAMNKRQGLPYGYRKVDKGWNFQVQPTKVHLNLFFIIFQSSHLIINNYKIL